MSKREPRHLCHDCAVEEQVFTNPPTILLASTYQLDKYLKHTVPNPTKYNVQSVFLDPGVQAYSDYVVTSAAAGSVLQDQRGTTFVWAAGKPTGFEIKHGKVVQPAQDAVKVVLSSDPGKIHAYPQHSTTFTAQCCTRCGNTWLIE